MTGETSLGGGIAALRSPESHCWTIWIPCTLALFKGTSSIRPKDEAEFRMALPRLDAAQRYWLRDILTLHDAVHPWLPLLAAMDENQAFPRSPQLYTIVSKTEIADQRNTGTE